MIPNSSAAARPARQLALALRAIRFSHSIFALPFALVAMLLAAGGWPSGWTFFWILVACVAARTAAMAFNRLHDAPLDRLNPRTRDWPLASGLLSRRFMWGFMLAAAALFIVAAGMLNWLALALSPVALAVLLGYSTTKRWTRWSHFWLGAALGIAPAGAWIGVSGGLAGPPLLLGLGVLLWVAGFDIIYSCQDDEFDRRMGLHSLPARLGRRRALLLARVSHGAAIVALAAVAAISPLGGFYLAAVGAAGLLLAWEHSIVAPSDLSRLNLAFFTINGWVGVLILLGSMLDLLLMGGA